jgi:hypothetical protein
MDKKLLGNFSIKSPHFEGKMNGFANILGKVEQIFSFLILKSSYLAHMFYWFANK